MKNICSWGRVRKIYTAFSKPQAIDEINLSKDKPNLAIGLARSYGDSCLLENGQLIETTRLRKLIYFNREKGILKAEAGISFTELLEIIIPAGWFLPVTPGTQFITLGGAIANDVHGKNHHIAGSFGNYVNSFELLCSDNKSIICSPTENTDLFNASIGGVGLTGIIKSAEISLIPIQSSYLDTETIKFNNIDEFFTIAWVDCLANGSTLGRGLFSRAKFCEHGKLEYNRPKSLFSIPFEMPSFLLNKLSVKLFNYLYFGKQQQKIIKSIQSYRKYFYPLDKILNWNKLYGKNGFYQYQCVIPNNSRKTALAEILNIISQSGQGSFLAVLKTFGNISSPGLISFPMEGVTLALDFQNKPGVLELFAKLDVIVVRSGGRLYPAKDGRIPADIFKSFYPSWQKLEALRDPAINSLFWQHITKHEKHN